jgi:hypothetical protein
METSNAASMIVPVHRMTPYLRVRITTFENSIRIEDRPALLGIIPLRRRRIEMPFADLDAHRFKTVVRFDAIAAAGLAIAAIFLFHPPLWAIVVLAVTATLMIPFAAPNGAVLVRRADGRTWTIRYCRDYRFDLSLALTDAEQRGVSAQPTGERAA